MKTFPIDEKLCLLNSFLNKYTDTMSFFAWELKKFRTNKYILEKYVIFHFICLEILMEIYSLMRLLILF